MAEIGLLLSAASDSLKEVQTLVDGGYILTQGEADALCRLSEQVVALRNTAIRNEVLAGHRLRVIADRWVYTPARICQIASKSPEYELPKGD
jgi:hypothetical protein